jgi:hypothetical protein
MRNSIKILVMLAIVSMAGMANAQSSANVNADINATVIAPITITKTNNMALGKIVTDPTGGTMAIAANGARTFSNSANKTAGNPSGLAAAFHVTGDASSTFSTLHTGLGAGGDATGTWLYDAGNVNSMWFLFDADNTAQSLAGGAADVKVTGTLTIGASQAAGSYTGSFTELVAYE